MKNKNKVIAFISSLGGLLALWLGLNLPKPPKPEPTPSPTATATATETPAPTATPVPSALPTPSPAETPFPQCSLPPSEGKCEDNPTVVGIYSLAVASAQQKVADEGHFVDAMGKVVNEGAYTEAVANKLREVGYCAANKLSDEVVLKLDNKLSETYDIVTGQGDVWRKFVYRCVPAGF